MTAPGHIRIPYWGIRLQIEKTLRNWPDLHGVRIELEPSGEPAPESLPAIFLFLSERQTLPPDQRIAAGTRTYHRLVFSAWSLAYSPESMAVAVQQRDSITGELELALMADRKLGGILPKSLELQGGFIRSGSDVKPALFATAMETLILCDVYCHCALG